MTTVPHPGISELGWLADLKETAEGVGFEVYGEAIRWDVEVLGKQTKKRPDVVIRRDETGEVLASGEAKRPDHPAGVHPLVASEVSDALQKAQILGGSLCFTTNFFECAVFDAENKPYGNDLDRLQGGLIPLIDDRIAKAPDWWSSLHAAERAEYARLGLKQLFERLKASAAGTVPRDINEAALLVFSRTTARLVGPLCETLIHQRKSSSLQAELIHHGLRVQLVLTDDRQARYLLAQGIAEVLTASLFYQTIADHFSLP